MQRLKRAADGALIRAQNRTAKLYQYIPELPRTIIGNSLWHSSVKVAGKLIGAKTGMTNTSVKLSYAQLGKKGAPILIFIHGFGDRKEGFYQSALWLKNHFNIYLVDLPGFGLSERPEDKQYSIKFYATLLEEFAQYFKLDKFLLMGNSLGGAVALRYGIDYPHRVTHLFPINAAGVIPENSKCIYDEFLAGKNMFVMESFQDFEYFLGRVFHKKPFIPFHLRLHLADIYMGQKDWLERLTWEIIGHGDFRKHSERDHSLGLNEELKNVQVPTTIFWGEQDSLFPMECAEIMQENIPNARLHVFEGVGHSPQMETPKRFSKVFKSYL